jgi:hypothetical protein
VTRENGIPELLMNLIYFSGEKGNQRLQLRPENFPEHIKATLLDWFL